MPSKPNIPAFLRGTVWVVEQAVRGLPLWCPCMWRSNPRDAATSLAEYRARNPEYRFRVRKYRRVEVNSGK